MKVGLIGLGDIAAKAYLPVIAKKDLEVHLFTRNEATLSNVARSYWFAGAHQTLESLVTSGIQAAFVHTSTSSHREIVETLLQNNIHVYVDKPVTYDFGSTEKLVELANRKGCILMAGFNRRYAPAYVSLKHLKDINMILMQKNRKSLPGDVRTFVFDDFIHVIDTLLYLFPVPVESISITGRKLENRLYHVVIQFHSTSGITAIGIMNRDSGTVEERVEVFSPEEKRCVTNVTDTTIFKDGDAIGKGGNDWQSTLHKRGFEQITDAFLNAVAGNESAGDLHRDLLLTHKICEQVVAELL
ncbi:MAG TPA: Gfo/Idh/MocA family oxidoreductase [Chryseosolibacter sp.]